MKTSTARPELFVISCAANLFYHRHSFCKLGATILAAMTGGRWQYASRLRRGVSRSIDVAGCINRNIVVSVIGPQSAGDESVAKGRASPKGKAFPKGKASTKRLAEAAVADRKAVTRKAATDKMGAAAPGAVTKSHGVGRHSCHDEYSGRSGCKVPPRHQNSSCGASRLARYLCANADPITLKVSGLFPGLCSPSRSVPARVQVDGATMLPTKKTTRIGTGGRAR